MATTFNPLTLNFDGNPAPKIKKYNTWEINLTWTAASAPVDLSYYTAQMQLRKNSQSPIAISLSTSNNRIILTSQGNIKLKISAADTATLAPGKYQYDLTLIDSSAIDTNGEGMSSFTLFSGEITVDDSSTRETV